MPLFRLTTRVLNWAPFVVFTQCSAGSETRDDAAHAPMPSGSTAGGTPGEMGGQIAAAGAPRAAGDSSDSEGATSSADWLFHEDFEGQAAGMPPGAPWEVTGYGSKSVATTADRAFSGSQSVHFHVDNPARSFITTNKPFPVTGNTFYGRMMVWFDKLPTAAQGVHWDMVSASGDGGNTYLWGGQYDHVLANYHPGDCYAHERALKPLTAKWHCVEWQFDGPGKTLNIWLDGAAGNVTARGEGCVMGANHDWDPPASWQTISFGWSHYQQDLLANDVWIDDIVIDEQRIGCPAVP